MKTYRWDRIALIAATAVTGLGTSYLVLTSDEAPKYLVALSGLLLITGTLATIALLIFLEDWVTNHLRPSIRLRKPKIPLALASKQASFVGRANFIHHPVRFWGALTFGNRCMFGFMWFDEPQHLSFDETKPLTTEDTPA